MSATSLDDESIIADGYYFEDGILSEKLDKFFASVLLTLDESPNIVLEKIKRTIERHIRKIHQSLEDDPHEFLSSLLPSDIIKQGYDHDHKIGSWGTLIDDVEALSDKPIEYWKKLFLEYIISPPRVELMMIPDIELSKSMSDEEVRLDLERQKQYGEEGLKKLSKTLDDAVSANKVDLPRHVIDTMPPIPSTREIAKLQKKVDIEATNCILSRVIVVKTETRFSHLRLFIGLDGLSKNLLPYLVLFQEMLFESGVRDLSYTDVVDKTADLCVNHEAAIGVGTYF